MPSTQDPALTLKAVRRNYDTDGPFHNVPLRMVNPKEQQINEKAGKISHGAVRNVEIAAI